MRMMRIAGFRFHWWNLLDLFLLSDSTTLKPTIQLNVKILGRNYGAHNNTHGTVAEWILFDFSCSSAVKILLFDFDNDVVPADFGRNRRMTYRKRFVPSLCCQSTANAQTLTFEKPLNRPFAKATNFRRLLCIATPTIETCPTETCLYFDSFTI